MEIYMDRIISNYIKWKSDNSKLDKYEMREKIENGIYKINLIRTYWGGCGYQAGYIGRSEEFLNSIERRNEVAGTLSIKQKKAESNVQKVQTKMWTRYLECEGGREVTTYYKVNQIFLIKLRIFCIFL